MALQKTLLPNDTGTHIHTRKFEHAYSYTWFSYSSTLYMTCYRGKEMCNITTQLLQFRRLLRIPLTGYETDWIVSDQIMLYTQVPKLHLATIYSNFLTWKNADDYSSVQSLTSAVTVAASKVSRLLYSWSSQFFTDTMDNWPLHASESMHGMSTSHPVALLHVRKAL